MREVSTAAGIYALRLLRDRRSGRLGQMAVLPPTRCSKHDNNVSLPCGSAKILILMHQELYTVHTLGVTSFDAFGVKRGSFLHQIPDFADTYRRQQT